MEHEYRERDRAPVRVNAAKMRPMPVPVAKRRIPVKVVKRGLSQREVLRAIEGW